MKYLVKFTDSDIQNIILNICILLFGINFLYRNNYIVFGAFILLVIFKKFKISFGNIGTLIVLSLFALSWFVFSEGHEISGICLPLCYLFGCNIDKNDEKGTTKFILLVSISLALYTTLFFFSNAVVNGITNYDVSNQPNIWTGRPLWPTNIMLYSSLFYSCFGYILFFNKKKSISIAYGAIFCINAFYALMLGRRAALLMIVLSAIIAFVYKIITDDKEERKNTIKILLIIFTIGIIGFILFFAAYMLNIGNFKYFVKTLDLYQRFISNPSHDKNPLMWVLRFLGDSGRSIIRKGYYEHFFEYMWGGSKIHEIVGNYAHDLWLDVYDVAGIISLILIVIYTILYGIKVLKLTSNKKLEKSFKVLIVCILICSIVQFSIEPIMEACKSYMYAICMIHGSLEILKEKDDA